jgi:hypothetical protein
VKRSIWIGFDSRHAAAAVVCRHSILRRLTQPLPVRGVVLEDLRRAGVYTRPTEIRKTPDGLHDQLWDVISEAPMSTEFAISRFLTPWLAGSGWAVFMDCDMKARVNMVRLFEQLDPRYAVMCVKHRHEPTAGTKMDGQTQTQYQRKNWSSVMAFNVDHPANDLLTVELINSVPGRDLHRFCWLTDDLIGELHQRWNHLVGYTQLYEPPGPENPAVIHWTDGYPLLKGYERADYADEFFVELNAWAKQ